MTAGTAIGQALMLASLPLIARIYEPGDVGRFGVVLAGATVAGIAVTGRVQQILPRVENSARWPIIWTLIVVGSVLAPLGALVLMVIVGALTWLSWVAATCLVVGVALFNVLTFVGFAERQYEAIAKMRVVNGLVTAAAQILGGLMYPSAETLVATFAFGSLAACVFTLGSLRAARAAHRGRSFREVAASEGVAKFAATVGSTALISNLSLAAPMFGIAFIYGDAAAGSFFLARRVLVFPVQLVASTVSDVSYSMVARKSASQIRRHVRSWLRRLRWVAGLLLVGGAAGGPVAAWLVGPEYQYVMVVVWLMTIPASAQLVGTSMANILLALNLEILRLVLNIFKLVALAIVFGLAYTADVPYLAGVAMLALALVAWYSTYLVVTVRAIAKRESAA